HRAVRLSKLSEGKLGAAHAPQPTRPEAVSRGDPDVPEAICPRAGRDPKPAKRARGAQRQVPRPILRPVAVPWWPAGAENQLRMASEGQARARDRRAN